MPHPTARNFLAGRGLLAATALAQAAAPPAKGQAPGWYRMPLGDFEVTALSDDTVDLPADGKAVFPDATVRADARESGFWLDQATMNRSPEAMKDFFTGAIASMKPYVDAGRFKPFERAAELVPGIEVMPTHCHTPGHTAYKKAYADASRNGYYVAVAYVAFPGIGRLRADGKGCRWLPANYTTK